MGTGMTGTDVMSSGAGMGTTGGMMGDGSTAGGKFGLHLACCSGVCFKGYLL